jgi:c-di-GMP-binding flagellar brake protein YcgR
MSDAHHQRIDMSKYFRLKQKAYLINLSEHRDQEQYESLSGTIVGRGVDSIAIQVRYPTEYTSHANGSLKTTFKLTTEALGNGIQVIVDLLRVETGNVFHLKPRGNLEMYQRRQSPRIDDTIKMYQIQHNSSLEVYRREFRRITGLMKSQGVPANLVMREATINLSAGGVRVVCEAKVAPSHLSLFFFGLDDNQIPVCALGELAWNRIENDARMCGYRFIQISKADQKRIVSYIQSFLKRQNVAVSLHKANWELLDRMMYDEAVALP